MTDPFHNQYGNHCRRNSAELGTSKITFQVPKQQIDTCRKRLAACTDKSARAESMVQNARTNLHAPKAWRKMSGQISARRKRGAKCTDKSACAESMVLIARTNQRAPKAWCKLHGQICTRRKRGAKCTDKSARAESVVQTARTNRHAPKAWCNTATPHLGFLLARISITNIGNPLFSSILNGINFVFFMFIFSSGMSASRNVTHASFHRRVYNMVTQFLLDVLSLTIPAYLWEEWKRLVDLETDLCNEARASVLSAEMSDVNKLRTAELSNLFRQIKRFARSGNSEFMRAAAQLMTLVNAYAGIQRKKRVEKSGLIIGLIIDLRKPENASCVEVLNIGSLVDQLETYNNRFEELHEQRVNYYADKIQEKMAELRPKTDVCYQKVCILIEAAFINAVTNEERESLSGLISRINETYNSMGIGRKKRRNKKIDADSAANIAANTGSDDANVTDGQTPADESSTPSTPAGDEGANEGSQDGSQSDTHEGDQGEGQGSEQPSAPDTGGFMG